MATFSTGDIETFFTATSQHALWPQSKLHTQWPGTGKAGDPIFDTFFASQVQYEPNRIISERDNTHAYLALLDRVGPAYVLTHSQAGTYGFRLGDARPDLVQGLISLEPSGPPFETSFPFTAPWRKWGLTDLPIAYEPDPGPDAGGLSTVKTPAKDPEHEGCIMQVAPARMLKRLARVRMLVVSGEASYHARYDYCTVDYLRQAGVEVEYADLGTEGMKGNGHMMFMEKNNLEIARRVERWMKE